MENNVWKGLTEESKRALRDFYKEVKEKGCDFCNDDKTVLNTMQYLFGYENLENDVFVPKYKTWNDFAEDFHKDNNWNPKTLYDVALYTSNERVQKKVIATYKIGILIEQSYGGIITEEEWSNPKIQKYSITANSLSVWGSVNKRITLVFNAHPSEYRFIAFHTEAQRKEFLKNNRQLCYDYFMIDNDIDLSQYEERMPKYKEKIIPPYAQ